MGRRNLRNLSKMEAYFFRLIGGKKGISRLFIGGVYGKEGLSTIHSFKTIKDINVNEGSLVLCNLPPSPYLSTLDPLYFLSLAGMKVIDIIQKYQPGIYLELHCYHPEKKQKLMNKNRKDISGVPGLIEIEEGVLIGSTSPRIRSTFFELNDFPFILEIPCNPPANSLEIPSKFMKIAAKSTNRSQIMKKIRKDYPYLVERLDDYFHEFSQNFWPAFKEVKKNALEMEMKTSQDLDKLITGLVREGGFDLNPVQMKQLGQAFMVYREYNLPNSDHG